MIEPAAGIPKETTGCPEISEIFGFGRDQDHGEIKLIHQVQKEIR
jgi:hypothetical protein